jgi:hypothetical protein
LANHNQRGAVLLPAGTNAGQQLPAENRLYIQGKWLAFSGHENPWKARYSIDFAIPGTYGLACAMLLWRWLHLSQRTRRLPCPTRPRLKPRPAPGGQKLTLEQKIELLGGVDSMYTHAMPAIGLPRFKMSDASVGVRTWGPTTPMPAAWRWPPPGIRIWRARLGEALGKDARARNVNFLLGPGVNIARSPIAAATSNTCRKTRSEPRWWSRTFRACSRRASSPR